MELVKSSLLRTIATLQQSNEGSTFLGDLDVWMQKTKQYKLDWKKIQIE